MVPACKGNTKMLNCKIYLRRFFAKLPTFLHKFACIPHKYRHFESFYLHRNYILPTHNYILPTLKHPYNVVSETNTCIYNRYYYG